MLWKTLYNTLVIPALTAGFYIAARFSPKIHEGLAGRRSVFDSIKGQLSSARELNQTAWFHFTSVGEFEQAKPLIEALKDEVRIVLTYFSPSVHPNVARYPHHDAAIYLPLDTSRNAEHLFQIIEPSLLVFSKFDIWPNLVWHAAKHSIPVAPHRGNTAPQVQTVSVLCTPFFQRCPSTYFGALRDFGERCATVSPDLSTVRTDRGDRRYPL